MITIIFRMVAGTLFFIGKLTGRTYNEVNIIVYYFLVPLSWFIMLDFYFRSYFISIAFIIFSIGVIVGCRNFKSYSDWLFGSSVKFLNFFNRYGSNYYASSVYICVAIPIIIYGILISLIIIK